MTAAARAPGGGPLAADLDLILAEVGDRLARLRGARLFITGGTGFVGSWLLESLLHANRGLGLGATALVLSRDPAAFRRASPRLAADPAISLCPGDVRDFAFPEGRFSHVIHAAATSAVETFGGIDLLETFDIVLEGTRRALDFAGRCGAARFLFVGSGAVYGPQPADLTRLPEDYPGAPFPASRDAALGEGKRAAECLCALVSAARGFEVAIARCFSFVGPYLPLDVHYAVGNFMRDALAGGPIRVRGDGTPVRSYLYAADLAAWLWAILLDGAPCRPYNVGSEEGVSIAELARMVAAASGDAIEVSIAEAPIPGAEPQRYVPSTERVRRELELEQTFTLGRAIARTLEHHRGT